MPLLREYPTDYLDSTSEFRSETPFLECILSGIYPESNLVFHSTNLECNCYLKFFSTFTLTNSIISFTNQSIPENNKTLSGLKGA